MDSLVDPPYHRYFHRTTVWCDEGTQGNLLVEVVVSAVNDIPTDLGNGGRIKPKDRRSRCLVV